MSRRPSSSAGWRRSAATGSRSGDPGAAGRDLAGGAHRGGQPWLARPCAARTAWLIAQGRGFVDVTDGGPTMPEWSDIKDVYRDLQGQTCAYCEKPMAEQAGAVEHDVEHFRPKGRTTGWGERQGRLAPPKLGKTIRKGHQAGYYWLAYHPFNYAAACKVCNSTLKGDRFPILAEAQATPAAGADPLAPEQVEALAEELPLLLYPIGAIDDDPETVITWHGVVPLPREAEGSHGWRRALATLTFFELAARDDLRRQRAMLISLVWAWHQAGLTAAADALLANPKTPFKACLRAFRALIDADPAVAATVAQDAQALATGVA